ncbi:DNA repair protein SWI5 homolog [Latimeria chalumnae]|uniref:DNA repair protein SWI5 homolog n=1 Tax=Latimeria chalumnae TaxID=7897 RepID=UPI0003C1297D|nr:PREDICTED: DNA repair protein SWI5 homolog [Latimeria chalumnae]|eukprot:XP_005992209.1 PREDICTED: DNA repair protein SWI5 homolog [Latimeria chalumnae]
MTKREESLFVFADPFWSGSATVVEGGASDNLNDGATALADFIPVKQLLAGSTQSAAGCMDSKAAEGRPSPLETVTPGWAGVGTPSLPAAGSAGQSRTTSAGIQRKSNLSFKSPLQMPRTPGSGRADRAVLEAQIEDLKKKRDALDADIEQLLSEGYSLEELEKHISLLHEYNDVKDVGQLLLGKLAVVRGVPTRDLYGEFKLELED